MHLLVEGLGGKKRGLRETRREEGDFCPLQHIHSTMSVLNTPFHSSVTLFLFFPNASHREKCAGPIFAQKWCWDRQITYQYLSLASHAPNSHPPPVQLIDWLGKKLGPLSSDQGHTTHGLCATHPPPNATTTPSTPTTISSSSSFLSLTHMMCTHACMSGLVWMHSLYQTYLDKGMALTVQFSLKCGSCRNESHQC